MAGKGIVIGSYVVDLMARTQQIPRPAETVRGHYFKMGAGGKGFNQCVAATRAGADMTMVTKVGNDVFAQPLYDTMRQLGLQEDGIFCSDQPNTGTALILVAEQTGQNAILVTPGACEQLTTAEIDQMRPVLSACDYLLTQLEINDDALAYAIGQAKQLGVSVILNPAPAHSLPDALLAMVDVITPNEVEAQTLTGIAVTDEKSAAQAAAYFHQKGVAAVCITMGGQGVFVSQAGRQQLIPAFSVPVVDTTGAGDAFNGGLLTALLEGKDLFAAAVFASALAALSVQKLGTAPSMPQRDEIDTFLQQQHLA